MSDDNEHLAPPSAAEVMAAKHARSEKEPVETTDGVPAPEKAVASRAARKR